MDQRKSQEDVLHEAVGLYLATATRGSGVRAVALAGEEGSLLGGTGTEDLALLAALGAGCADKIAGYGQLDELVDAVAAGDDFYASRLTVCDRTFYLASIGARVPRQKEIAAELGRLLAPKLSS